MKTIAIIDTQGPGGISDLYRNKLPGIRISGDEPPQVAGQPCDAHGALCGWLAALPLAAVQEPARLVFLRCFDQKAQWIKGVDDWILDRIDELRPDYVSRSWGAWDGDDQLWRQIAAGSFKAFADRYAPMIRERQIADFGAAGNDDANDADDDVAFPQAQLAGLSTIIGAHDRAGKPCTWSGDGRGVTATMWAERVWSPDAAGAWHLWSGTSAATPKACGVAAVLGLRGTAFAGFAERKAQRPRRAYTLPHPKWGWGSMEYLWQQAVAQAPALHPPPLPAKKIPAELHDYRPTRRKNAASPTWV